MKHGGVVTYIVYIRVCVCIDYLLLSIPSNDLRALSAVHRASTNPVGLRPVVSALHRVRLRGPRRFWPSDQAAGLPGFLCPALFHHR